MPNTATIQEIIFNFICFRKGLAKHGGQHLSKLPTAQGEALFSIAFKGEMTISELASHLNITPGAATQLVEALVQAGLLKRQQSEADRRVVSVCLSEKGKARIAEIKKHKMTLIKQTLSALTEAEQAELARLLKKINQASKQVKGE